MAWRSVLIQNPARLSLSKGQLRLLNDDGEHTLPVEDLTAIILESPQVTLTSSLLACCQDKGVAVVTCDQAHMPNGVMLPFQPHSRQSRVARIQLSWSEPLKKRLWQRIVQAKIAGQADVLRRSGGEAARLDALARQVQSGDPNNMEAQAARHYWPRLMGGGFRRGANDAVNAALNYGYAVIRAHVARSQVAYGLIPAFGVHHDNDLNAFNLTDDAMEVFRPFVDTAVHAMKQEGLLNGTEALTAESRRTLAGLGGALCLIGGETHTLAHACDLLAAGLVTAIEAKSAALLPVPVLPAAGS